MIDTSSSSKHNNHGSHGSPTLHKHKSKPLTGEEVKKAHCTHGPKGKCINCLGVTKEAIKEVKHKCTHPVGQKCPNCLTEEENKQQVKHESFEHFLSEIKSKCKGKHRSD